MRSQPPALALSGLLSREVGGPSVYPPQPDGLWQAAFNGQRTWSTSQGTIGYYLNIILAAGSSTVIPANDSWVATGNGNPAGIDNFAASPGGSTFDLAFIQHQPGPECGALIELPFEENLSACQRYFCKSNAYANLCPTSNDWTGIGMWINNSVAIRLNLQFPVEMAKVPAVTLYDNGVTANAVYPDYYGSKACSAGQFVTTAHCGYCSLNANPGSTGTNTCGVLGQWKADTGW